MSLNVKDYWFPSLQLHWLTIIRRRSIIRASSLPHSRLRNKEKKRKKEEEKERRDDEAKEEKKR